MRDKAVEIQSKIALDTYNIIPCHKETPKKESNYKLDYYLLGKAGIKSINIKK